LKGAGRTLKSFHGLSTTEEKAETVKLVQLAFLSIVFVDRGSAVDSGLCCLALLGPGISGSK